MSIIGRKKNVEASIPTEMEKTEENDFPTNSLENFFVPEVSSPDEVEKFQVHFLSYRIEQKLRSAYGNQRFVKFDMRFGYCQDVKEAVKKRYEEKGWYCEFRFIEAKVHDRMMQKEYLFLNRFPPKSVELDMIEFDEN